MVSNLHASRADLRQQAKGLCKVHLHDCLIDVQSKRQHKPVAQKNRNATARKANGCGI
jgi:hypothetical protein